MQIRVDFESWEDEWIFKCHFVETRGNEKLEQICKMNDFNVVHVFFVIFKKQVDAKV